MELQGNSVSSDLATEKSIVIEFNVGIKLHIKLRKLQMELCKLNNTETVIVTAKVQRILIRVLVNFEAINERDYIWIVNKAT